ncbi:putative golgi membrane protein [Ordospora pajunii]|uniref:putative golgi membrane protein n=1 Tax=Ordospora pajunii TaxID=3039483 RepID=UPI0029528A45|nr:putative golgi membrane protein [Ordospora pajunii]KAH9412143.1 putative golgi membrane protein [Ordospora pajunii]
MGLCISKIGILQILKVTSGSISHANGILPFVHSITGFNAKPVNSKDDVLMINKEWEEEVLMLEILDMRCMETFFIEIPKKNNEGLGIAVKFHESPVALLSMQVLRIHPNSPVEKCRMLVGDYILGIENMHSFDEEDLLETLYSKRGQAVPIVVYNDDLGYVRVVRVEVGMEILLGCQIGTGEMYRIPYGARSNRLELNAAVIKKDIDRLDRRIRGKEIIDRRMSREVVERRNSYPRFLNEGYNGMHQKELIYDVYSLHDKELHDTKPSMNVLLDIEDDCEMPMYAADDAMSASSIETNGINLHGDSEKNIIEILNNTSQDDNFDFEHELPLVCSINKGEHVNESHQTIYTGSNESARHYESISTENIYEPDANMQSVSRYEMQQCPLCLKFHDDEFDDTERYDGSRRAENVEYKHGYESDYCVEHHPNEELYVQEYFCSSNEYLEDYDVKKHSVEHEIDLEKSMLESENKIAQDIMEMKIKNDMESND